MPGYVTAAIVAGSGIAAQVIARLRFVLRPDEDGKCQLISGCTDHPIDGSDAHEIDVQRFDLHGTEVLIVAAQ